MASKAWGSSPLLKDRLLKGGPDFAFVQALRLLRRVVAREGGDGAPRALWRRVKVRPHLSMSFATADIHAITQEPGQPDYCVTVEFLGLYGSSSPLPNFYTEDLLDEQNAHGSTSRDFIDIVNSAVYPLYFESWGKHRLFQSIVEAEDGATLERLFCLLGLPRQCTDLDPYALLKYMGLFGLRNRSAEGLRALLADYFEEPSIVIVQCVERTVEISGEQRCRLGQANHQLGAQACLGSRVQDRMGKFRVELGPVGGAQLRRFLPGGKPFRELAELIKLYCREPLAWDLRIKVRPDQVAGGQLGGRSWSGLGRDVWLRTPGAPLAATEATFPEPQTWNRPRVRPDRDPQPQRMGESS